VAQAIETIQMLFFMVRTAGWPLAEKFRLNEGDEFDADWQWMGSYATWRAAIFVLLYPENLLIPNLRRRQTPGFRRLVSQMQGTNRVTPEVACQAARAYENYFKDVCSLAGLVCVEALGSIQSGSCRDRTIEAPRKLEFLFAVSQISQKGYWTTREMGDAANGPYGVGFWDEIPKIAGVRDFSGGVEYDAGESRFILLFSRISDGPAEKLLLLRYDLEKGTWWEPIELDLPVKQTSFTAMIRQFLDKEDTKAIPPRLVITLPNGATYGRQLNDKADGWRDDDFLHAKFSEWQDIPQSSLKTDPQDHWKIRFQRTSDYAQRQGFTFGFPNFHQGTNGYGTFLITNDAVEWRDVLESDLTKLDQPDPSQPTTPLYSSDRPTEAEGKRWFRLAHLYAVAQGFVGAFPTFHTADYGYGPVTGLMLVKTKAAIRKTVQLTALKADPWTTRLDECFRLANDYVRTQEKLKGGMFPTFFQPTAESMELIIFWGSTDDPDYWGSFLPSCTTAIHHVTPAFSDIDRFILTGRRTTEELRSSRAIELTAYVENIKGAPGFSMGKDQVLRSGSRWLF
jgi:hypothetical protein